MPTLSPDERRARILSLRVAASKDGVAPADAAKLLLVAAAHLAAQSSSEPFHVVIERLAILLGDAAVEAADLLSTRH